MDIYTTLLIIVGIYLLVYIIAKAVGIDKLDEKGINAGTPFFVLWKTERLNAFLTKMGKTTIYTERFRGDDDLDKKIDEMKFKSICFP